MHKIAASAFRSFAAGKADRIFAPEQALRQGVSAQRTNPSLALAFSLPFALTFPGPCLYKAARDFGFAPTSFVAIGDETN